MIPRNDVFMKSNRVKKISAFIAQKSRDIFKDKLNGLILFGSYARGDFNSGSDIDFILLVDIPQEDHAQYRRRVNELASSLSLEYDITVSIKLKDSNTFYRYKESVPFYANVINEGVSISV